MRILLFVFLSLACGNVFSQNSRGQLLPFKESYKWGYINFSGQVVIPARFDIAANFEGNFAVVRTEGKTGMISSSGKQLIPCMYRNVQIFSSNLIAVREKELWGLVDSANVPLLNQEYQSIEMLNPYSLKLQQNSKFGLYHTLSKKVLPCGFDTLMLAPQGFFKLQLKGRIGMADSSHTVVVEPAYDNIKVEKPALMLRKNGFWSACNKAGRIGAENIWKNYKIVSDDFLMLQDAGGLWALYSSEDNRVLTKPEYNDFKLLTKNLIMTIANKKKGLINKHGKLLMEPAYDDFVITQYLINVRSEQKWGIADFNGKMLHEPAWKIIGEFKDNIAVVASESNTLGLINTKGKIVASPKYSNVEYSDMSVKCYVDGQMDLITYDEQGNFVDKTTYKNVKTLQIGPYSFGDNSLNNNFNNNRNNNRTGIGTPDTLSIILRTQTYSYPQNARTRSPIPNNVKEIRMLFGIYDLKKRMLIVEIEKWDIILEDFRSGTFARIIEAGGRFGLMDRRGYTKMDFTVKKNGKFSREKISYIGNFSENLARINVGGALTGSSAGSSTALPNPYTSLRTYSLGCIGGLWGFINRQGQLAITPQYDFVDDFHNGRAIVKMNGKYGVINLDNEFVIKPEYDYIEFLRNTNNSFYAIYLNTPRYGVINDKGQILVQVKYESLGNWQEGLSPFRSGKKFGFIDVDGQVAIPAEYDKVKDFSENLAAVQKNRLWGYIDHAGNFVIQPAYSSAGNFQNGKAPVTARKGNGYVNPKGEVTFSKYSKCFEYYKGMAKVKVKGKFGFIDEKGKWVIHPHYKNISDFNQYNMAIVKKGRKYGVIDRKGHHVTHISYQKIGAFSEGYAAVQRKNKYGFIDSTGKVVIEPQYMSAGKFSEGLAAISVKGRWGFINPSNKITVNPKYRKAGEFVENLARVRNDRSWGFINKSGSEVIPLKYGFASDFKDGIAIAGSASTFGDRFITQQGKVLYDSSYQQVLQFEDKIARVKKYGKWGLIDKDGLNIIDYKYDGIASFSGQKSVVMIEGVRGIADLDGRIIAAPEYQRLSFVRGFFYLEKSDEVGYLRTDGTWLWEPKK
jgi:hypothetical protein